MTPDAEFLTKCEGRLAKQNLEFDSHDIVRLLRLAGEEAAAENLALHDNRSMELPLIRFENLVYMARQRLPSERRRY